MQLVHLETKRKQEGTGNPPSNQKVNFQLIYILICLEVKQIFFTNPKVNQIVF